MNRDQSQRIGLQLRAGREHGRTMTQLPGHAAESEGAAPIRSVPMSGKASGGETSEGDSTSYVGSGLGTPLDKFCRAPDMVQRFASLGLRTAADVLFYFPRKYDLLAAEARIQDLRENQQVTLRVQVLEVEGRATSTGKHMLCALFSDGVGYARGIWFNQPFVQKQLPVGRTLLITGRPRMNGLRWEFVHPQIRSADGPDADGPGTKLLPVYRLQAGIKQSHVRRLTSQVLREFLQLVPEVLPASLRERRKLPGITDALREMHRPSSEADLESARRRLAFQEFLIQQLAFALRRQQLSSQVSAYPLPGSPRLDARIKRLFPFSLTAGQQEVIAEIAADLARTVPMARLLHGDVGCGKTVVAAYAMLTAAAARCQSAIMAPTEILAHQHFDVLSRLLDHARVRLALWTGALRGRERETVGQEIAEGKIDIVVGTQALVQSGLQFAKLALVVVDEQHRFGVCQRAKLTRGQIEPHYLVMTATPIPRTMALLAYGDLAVSILREPPPGRQPVRTYLVEESQESRWWEFFRRQLRSGRQGYVIVPRLNVEDDESEWSGLEQAFESLAHGELSEFRLGLLHGRMPVEEKLAVMHQFRARNTDVLLATSVVEIGVDVPNATLMVIQNAERFGLAQLHQLRGRVARGAVPGYVGLFARPVTRDAQARLNAFLSTCNGFELAELDLKLRGPGDFFGTRQHGESRFRIARIPDDAELLFEARHEAEQLLWQDPQLSQPEHAGLLKQVLRRYGSALELGSIG